MIPAAVVSFASMNRTLARLCALACILGATAFALPSDELLDSLQVVAVEHGLGGRFGEREQAEALLEILAKQRIAADSTPAVPLRRLHELNKVRAERAKREAMDVAAARKPPPEVARLLNTPEVPDSTVRPVAPPVVPTPSSGVASARSTCPGGAVRFRWLGPSGAVIAQHGEGVVDARIRLEAPCGLTRIELYVDDLPPRGLPVPRTGFGSFEFTDHPRLGEGVHRMEVLACDTTYLCSRSLPMEARVAGSVPPWIPRAIGALVLVCCILGLALLVRRRPHAHRGVPPSNRLSAVTVPETNGLSGTLRKRLQLAAQEIGPAFPAVSLRLPDHIPALSIDPESLGDAFSAMLHLHSSRAAAGGQMLIAMGHGPVSAEVVFEDTAASPDDDALHAIFDPSKPRVRERMGLDRELELAVRAFQRAGGSVVAEIRIDGGLRTRMKIPLSHGEAKAA